MNWKWVVGIGALGLGAYVLYQNRLPEETVYASSPGMNGFSGAPSSIGNIQSIINEMKSLDLTLYRMSFTPQWNGGVYRSDFVEYFLNNSPSDWKLVVDRNHLYPNNETQSAKFRANLSTARSNILNVCKAWPSNQRVIAELVNEYVSSDIKTICQGLINNVRGAGYSNPLLVNKMEQLWSQVKFTDPKNNIITGFHPYFNSWSVSGAEAQMGYALNAGYKVINTEVGADYREHNYFTTSTVSEVNQFLQWCTDRGIGNCIWMNDDLNNLPEYKDLGLKIPSYSPPSVSYTLGIQANIPVPFSISGVGYYTTPKYLSLPADQYQVNMPSSVYYNGKTRSFRYWGSGETTPIRIIDLSGNIYPYATYY